MKDYRDFESGNFLFQSSRWWKGQIRRSRPSSSWCSPGILLSDATTPHNLSVFYRYKGSGLLPVAFGAMLDRDKSCRGNLTV
jgi:hypothetical protein